MGIEVNMNNKSLGSLGEDTAVQLMAAKGYTVIRRNYRCKFGEIDIIASRGNNLYFVEVKTRQGQAFGRPCEAVTQDKQRHIRKAAVFYLKEQKAAGYAMPRVHFQVIEIVIDHIDDAF